MLKANANQWWSFFQTVCMMYNETLVKGQIVSCKRATCSSELYNSSRVSLKLWCASQLCLTRAPLWASSGWMLPCSVRPVLMPAFLHDRDWEQLWSFIFLHQDRQLQTIKACITFWHVWWSLQPTNQHCWMDFSELFVSSSADFLHSTNQDANL